MKKTGNVIQGKLLIKQADAEEVTAGGIIIPSLAAEKPKRGTVIVVGSSTGRTEILCKVGDVVFFPDHAGTEIAMDDDDINLKGTFLLVDYAQVLVYATDK